MVLLALFVCDGLYSAAHPNQGKGISASSAVMQDAQGTGDAQNAEEAQNVKDAQDAEDAQDAAGGGRGA